MFLWLIITLSAGLFNLAFFIPNLFGWGALVGIGLIWWSLCLQEHCLRSTSVRYNFYMGLWWGALVFFSQLYWVLCVLISFSNRSPWILWSSYIVLCSYFTCTCGLWYSGMAFLCWHVQSNAGKVLICTMFTFIYFVWLGQWGALILASGDGYPLLNPLIPLCSYQWFIRLICCVSALMIGPNYFRAPIARFDAIAYLAPLGYEKSGVQGNLSILGQKIYHSLCDIYEQQSARRAHVYCAPESFFPYALNKQQELINFWSTAFSPNQKLVLGAHYEQGNNMYQAAFFIEKSRIKKIYVKKHLVPFVEHIPWLLQQYNIKQGILNDYDRCFSYKKNKAWNKTFFIEPGLQFIPQLCSEFIWSHKTKCFRQWMTRRHVPIILWLVNDHWFIPSFRRILQLAGRLRGAWVGIPIIYVGYEIDENKTTARRL